MECQPSELESFIAMTSFVIRGIFGTFLQFKAGCLLGYAVLND